MMTKKTLVGEPQVVSKELEKAIKGTLMMMNLDVVIVMQGSQITVSDLLPAGQKIRFVTELSILPKTKTEAPR